MKKSLFLFLISSLLFSLTPTSTRAQELSERLKGKILLQVEGVGQSWYVDPQTSQRAFLGRPADAFRIMRELGLGISEANYNTWGGTAPSRLSGRILLRVEANGEAYYINPDDLKIHYLGRPADAFRVMREQGLGITDNNLNQVPVYEKYSEEKIEEETALSVLQKQLQEQAEMIKELQDKQAQQEKESTLLPLTASEIAKKVKPGVVYISTLFSIGTGMLLDGGGYILTNAHVVQGANTALINLYDNRSYMATVVGRDEDIDLAILKISATNLTPIELGNSSTLEPGDNVYTIGYSEGLMGEAGIKNGIFSRSFEDGKYLEHTAEMSHGNSGGPLVNEFGFVIGINAFIYSTDDKSDPLKFSISINTAKIFIPLLKTGRNIIEEQIPEPESSITPPPATQQEPAPGTESSQEIVNIRVGTNYNNPTEFNVYLKDKAIPQYIESVTLEQIGSISDNDFEFITYNELNNTWKQVPIINHRIKIDNPGVAGRILINPKIKSSGLGKTLAFKVTDLKIRLSDNEVQGEASGLNESHGFILYPNKFMSVGPGSDFPLSTFCNSVGMGYYYEWFNDGACVTLSDQSVPAPGDEPRPVEPGTLNLSSDSSTPDERLVIMGDTGVEFTRVKFTAADENFVIDKLRIINKRYSVIGDEEFTGVTLGFNDSEGNTQTTFKILTDGIADFTNLDIFVPNNGSVVVKIKANLNTKAGGADNGSYTSLEVDATSNFRAVGLSSGSVKTAPDTGTTMNGNNMYIYESIPTVAFDSTTPSGTLIPSANTLVAVVSVTADAGKDITFIKGGSNAITFTVNAYGPVDGSTENWVLRDGSGNLLDTVAGQIGSSTVTFNFETAGLTVPAGQTKLIKVYVDTADYTVSGNSIQMQLSPNTDDVTWGINGSGAYQHGDILFKGNLYGGSLVKS